MSFIEASNPPPQKKFEVVLEVPTSARPGTDRPSAAPLLESPFCS